MILHRPRGARRCTPSVGAYPERLLTMCTTSVSEALFPSPVFFEPYGSANGYVTRFFSWCNSHSISYQDPNQYRKIIIILAEPHRPDRYDRSYLIIVSKFISRSKPVSSKSSKFRMQATKAALAISKSLTLDHACLWTVSS